MKLFFKECRRTVVSLVYILFLAVMIYSWWGNFKGVTKSEINSANGISSNGMSFDRPLLLKPYESDTFFGTKTSEENPEKIMTGVTRLLIMEHKNNCYSTYPIGYYKAVSLNDESQKRVQEIICEITGLNEEQLKNLPDDYFPAATGIIISTKNSTTDSNGNIKINNHSDNESDTDDSDSNDKTKKFISQVTYDHFKNLMHEMEDLIGEKNSNYSEKMMITYFGMNDMTYEEAYEEYTKTIETDKITGGFARLFCDYMGLVAGFYPVFITIFIWLKDRVGNTSDIIYSKRKSSSRIVISRFTANITAVLIPLFLLSLQSLIPLIGFCKKNNLSADWFAYAKYILWWLLPTVIIVTAFSMFITLLTDSPIAAALQFVWWIIDKGTTGLSGDTHLTTLMIRHNSLRGSKLISVNLQKICFNRLLITFTGIIFVILSIFVLEQKRRGKLNASVFYSKALKNIRNKF